MRTLLAAVAALTLSANGASAVTLTAGYDPLLMSEETVGARYRGQSSGNEHYVGIDNLGQGKNRNEAGYGWTNGPTNFLFTYDSADGLISSTLGSQTLTFAGTAGLVSDALQLTLSNRSKSTATFGISNLAVNGAAVSDLACTGFCDWMVTGYSVRSLLTVAGTITFDGSFGNNDSERVKFEIRSSTVAPVPLPAAGWLLLAGIGGLIAVGRRRRDTAPVTG